MVTFKSRGRPTKSRGKMAQHFTAKTTIVPLPETSVLSIVNCIPQSLSKSFLWQKYVLEMNSISQISREISSAKETVKRHLLLWDIQLRPSDNKQLPNKGQVGFGGRRIKAHIEQNKRELTVVQKMKALRNQGYSYWKIAEIPIPGKELIFNNKVKIVVTANKMKTIPVTRGFRH